MSKSHDIPTEAVEAVQSVGEDIQRLGELDDEEFHEFTALMETLGYEDEAEALRSSRRDWLKALGVAGAGLAAGGAGGMAVTGTARADPKSTQEGTYGDGNEDWEVQDITGNHADLNSVQTARANTAYHVLSSDDLQSRVNEAGPNSVLYVHGTHELTLTSTSGGHGLQIADDNVTLYLVEGAVIKLADNELTSGDSGRLIRIGDGSNSYKNIRIIGNGVVDGNKANNSPDTVDAATDIYIENGVSYVEVSVDIRESSGGTIWSVGTSSDNNSFLSIHDCTITDVAGDIVWKHTDHVVVTNNIIDNTTKQDGIEPAAESEFSIIANNIMRNTAGSGVDVFDGAQHVAIIGNVIDTPDLQGIDIGSNAEPGTPFITVAGNIIKGATGVSGIRCKDDVETRDILIQGNQIANNGQYGIEISPSCTSVHCIGNWVYENQRDGIYHQGSESLVSDNVAKNNNQGGNNNLTGIRVDGGSRLLVADNYVYDDQGTATQERGIYLQNITDSRVEGNYSWGHPEFNVYDASGANTYINKQAIESANAEEPQKDYPRGTIVSFNDTGDGSGTGIYVKLINEDWALLE